MKSIVYILLLPIFLLFITITPSFGAMIHLSSDLAGTSSVLNLPDVTATEMYVVADNFSPGETVGGFEFSLVGLPDTILVDVALPPGALDIDAGQFNFIVGTGTDIPTTAEPVLLATFTLFDIYNVEDLLISIDPSIPSGFNPDAPGWFDGLTNDIYPFTFASDLVINPVSLQAPPLYPAPIPEPSTFLLLGGGLIGLAIVVRRRRKE